MSTALAAHAAVAAVLVLALAGCAAPVESSQSVEPQPQPSGSTSAGHWGCLDAPPPAGSPSTPLSERPPADTPFDVSLVEAFTHAPIAGLGLVVCARTDADCAAPIWQAQADDQGVARLLSPGDPSAFDGFVRISGAGIATHYVFLSHRVAPNGASALPIEVYTPAALATGARASALALDPGKAVVRVDAHDCADAPAAGVAVSVGAFGQGEPAVAYVSGGSGELTRKATVTDASGIAVAFSVPESDVGVAELLGGRTAGGAIAFARAGAVSEIVVRP